MPRPLSEQVVVITGASSGIGRATAEMLARHGASVVLAARNEAALQEVAAEVERQGGQALAVPTDVSDPEQVHRLADQAADRFGRIDTWVNGAAVGLYGVVEQLSPEEIRRVVEVALLGTMYGARAALPHLRHSGGTLINISSVAGKRAIPLQGPYSAAEHGIVGFSDALRVELEHDQAGVAVTTILPYGIDTPFFNHARSKLGVMPRPTPPVYEPDAVAEAVLWAAEHPTREIVVGAAAEGLIMAQMLSPSLVDRLQTIGGLGFKLQMTNRPASGNDILFAPSQEAYRVRGDFGGETFLGNGFTRNFEFHPARQRLALAVLFVALAAAIRWGGRGASAVPQQVAVSPA
jgi:NAD(P)-dependent dehydrogenase (short-subunit alcohol dehydrogenase family)